MPSRKRPEADSTEWVLSLNHATYCSVGSSANESISWDGSYNRDRENEDRGFSCVHYDKQLLMVLDGHDGSKAVKFVHTHLPHNLLCNELVEGDEDMVKKSLKTAIISTETEFFVGIDPYITRKVTLQIEIEQKVSDLNSSASQRLFPSQVAEIERLDELIKGGTTAVVAFIVRGKLFVANVGDSRALICSQQGTEGSLMVKQLSVDHNTSNKDEVRRLEKCGLNPEALRNNQRLGTQENTRSIGDYSIKGGYTSVDILRHATSEPGTAEPHLSDPVDLSAFHGFLILMSDGLYKAYEMWTGRPDLVNNDIAHLVAKELENSPGDTGMVAQRVVEKVRSLYCNTCKKNRRSGRIDDITLIVKLLDSSSLPESIYPPKYLTQPPATVPSSAPVGSRQFEYVPPTPPYQHQPSQPVPSQYRPHMHQAPPTSLQQQEGYRDNRRGDAGGGYSYGGQYDRRPETYYRSDGRYAPDWNMRGGEGDSRPHPSADNTGVVPPARHIEGGNMRHNLSSSDPHFHSPGYNPMEGYRRELSFQHPSNVRQYEGLDGNYQAPYTGHARLNQQQYQNEYQVGGQSVSGSNLEQGGPHQNQPRPSVTFFQGDEPLRPADNMTPRPMLSSRQLSGSSLASDSSSSDLTLIQTPSMPTLSESEDSPGKLYRSSMLSGSDEPKGEAVSGNEGSPPDDDNAPRTMDSVPEGYITVSESEEEEEEEEEEEADGNFIKPYVRFPENFPADLSWYSIEMTT